MEESIYSIGSTVGTMSRLERVPADDLRDALEQVDGSRASRRLIAAIAYQNGVTQTELAEWFDVERKTVYNWLRRLEERPDALVEAARDDPRPGRPSKLTDEQRAELARVFDDRPSAIGYDALEWSPRLVRRHVREAFGVDYTLATCRRLLAEPGGGRRQSTGTEIDV